MQIDTHCHLDLFDDPIATALAYERARIRCIMATMLPSHFQMSLPHLRNFKFIQPALGMHPLRAKEAMNEINLFKNLVGQVDCVGEIGLDFSSAGRKTIDIQIKVLKNILPLIGNGKFVTIHSRDAHDEVLRILDEYKIAPVCFHFFTGGSDAAEKLISKGHYLSFNLRMLTGRHNYIQLIPRERILVESDGPFLTKRPLSVMDHVYSALSKAWDLTESESEAIISNNFKVCRTTSV